MAVNSTGSFSGSLITSELAQLRYLLTIADRAGLTAHPVVAAGYLGRATTSTRVERRVLGMGANEMAAETEGTGGTGVAISNAKVGATVAGQVLVREVTTFLRNQLGQDMAPEELLGFDLAIAAATRFMTMFLTAGQSATTSTSTTGVGLTAATFLAGVAAYGAKGSLGAGAVGTPMFVGHTKQVSDLATDITLNSGGQLQFGDEGKRMAVFSGGSFKGRFLDIDIYQSTRIATANAGADYSGLLLGPGSVSWTDQMPQVDDPSTQVVLAGGPEGAGIVLSMLGEIDRDSKGGITATVGRIFPGVEYNATLDIATKLITGV
jgi:hypothetical protein